MRNGRKPLKISKQRTVNVEKRNASTANETLNDLKNGKINGLVCLTHDHK